MYVQSSWFCSNRRRRLSHWLLVCGRPLYIGVTYFSFDIRSSVVRCLASWILPITYWPATYPAPTTPAEIRRVVLFRRSHRRVAWNIGSDISNAGARLCQGCLATMAKRVGVVSCSMSCEG